jgi:cytochrome c oxidase subunit 3
MNTAILILSSVTVIRAWMSLKMRRLSEYKKWMTITVICAFVFLGVKLIIEWPQKFAHFGAIIRKDRQEKYEAYLGNEHMKARGLAPRNEISGHLEAVEFTYAGTDLDTVKAYAFKKDCIITPAHEEGNAEKPVESVHAEKPAGEAKAEAHGPVYKMESKSHGEGFWPSVAEGLQQIKDVKLLAFEVKPDPVNEKPADEENDKPHFWPKHPNEDAKPIVIEADDIHFWSAFVPKHSTYFATYFMITGLHGLHVLGGALVFCFLLGPGSALYRKNPEHLANRVEVAGLFWHFVDLIWIFVFPLFYLL